MVNDQHTVPDTVAVETTLLPSFSPRKHKSMASRAILANFFEEKWTQNHPQYLSGLSHALFATASLEIAVYTARTGMCAMTKKYYCEF